MKVEAGVGKTVIEGREETDAASTAMEEKVVETGVETAVIETRENEEALIWAKCAAEAALSKKATDVMIIEVKPTLVIVDYFTIATADNPLQLKAVVETVEENLRKEYGIKPIGREGVNSNNWVLLDYGDIVVHVFVPETRDFYRLETLYNDAEVIVYQ